QTWSVDLEAGELDSSENSDIWFEADTATERFITPRNGALIAAVVLTGEIQVEDCAEAPFSTTRIDINTLAVGSYVCVQTNSGNYAVIRLDAAVGPSPGTLTVTYTVWAAGNLTIPQTWTVDLDTGLIGAGSLADIWFEAVTETERYVTPRNGAQIAAVGTTSLGRDGCAAVSLADSRIHINALPPGTYVCVRTNQGHYSEFRVNEAVGPSPGTLNISYSTSE
ncbi:MAG: hypothetical protein GY796_03525, partial [Chloroflexi bacterium]|nr:hypothetical protein [Chloroflexota bacterium]